MVKTVFRFKNQHNLENLTCDPLKYIMDNSILYCINIYGKIHLFLVVLNLGLLGTLHFAKQFQSFVFFTLKAPNIIPYLLFLKKRQNLKLSSAANYRWRFKG